MERFFNIRDWWGNGITLWVVVLLLFSAPLFAIVLKDVSLENDITTWLPSDDPDAQSLEWFSSEFERENRLIVSWDSSSLADDRVEYFAELLQRQGLNEISAIQSVTTPHDLIRTMTENKVDPDDAIDRLTGVLVGVGFLKVRLSDAGHADVVSSTQAIASAVQNVLGREVVVIPKVEPVAIEKEASDEEEPEQASRFFEIAEHDFQLRWEGITATPAIVDELQQQLESRKSPALEFVDKIFISSGAPVAVTIGLHQDDDHNLSDTLASIEAVAVEAGVEQSDIRLAGSPISRVRLNQAAKRAVWNPAYPVWNLFKRTPILLSAVISIVASFTLLRSLRLSLLVTAASVYTCLVVVSLIPMTGKSLNMVLIVLPDLLLVLTTSGAIHVANYWKHAVTQGDEFPIASAVKMAWQPCALASITTAIGMASLLTAVLEPVQQFGFFSSIGCLVSLVMILIGFPSMMSVMPGRGRKFSEHAAVEATQWGHLGRKLVHHRVAISTICLLVFGFSVVGLKWFQTETKVIRYFPKESRISRDYHYLEEGLSGIVSLDAVIRFDSEAQEKFSISDRMAIVHDVEQKIAQHEQISGTLSLTDFRDPIVRPAENASSFQKIRYRKSLVRLEDGIFEDNVESTSKFAKKASTPLEFQTHAGRAVAIAEGDEIWRIRAQSIVTNDVNYSSLTRELEQIIASTISDHDGTEYLVTGMVPLFLRTQQAVLESLIKSFGLAFGVIAVVLIILLRSPVSGLLAMIPNLFPVGVVFGIFSWLRIPVDIGTMITASVALGIAIDGTLHLITWFRDGIRHGLEREEAVVLALQHCGPAMWQTSATIALGMVMVAGADLLLISRFGILMAGLVAMALVADVILLPVMLGGPLGRIIQKHTPVTNPPLAVVDQPDTIHFRPNGTEEPAIPSEAVPLRTQT